MSGVEWRERLVQSVAVHSTGFTAHFKAGKRQKVTMSESTALMERALVGPPWQDI
jgi:hypothetical protein